MKRETWVSITTRRLRREKAMSKMELARRVGVHPSTIRNIENGSNLPNVTTLEAMLHCLGHELVVQEVE
jgi:DNA-binding XRE family transcriptional regulator